MRDQHAPCLLEMGSGGKLKPSWGVVATLAPFTIAMHQEHAHKHQSQLMSNNFSHTVFVITGVTSLLLLLAILHPFVNRGWQWDWQV